MVKKMVNTVQSTENQCCIFQLKMLKNSPNCFLVIVLQNMFHNISIWEYFFLPIQDGQITLITLSKKPIKTWPFKPHNLNMLLKFGLVVQNTILKSQRRFNYMQNSYRSFIYNFKNLFIIRNRMGTFGKKKRPLQTFNNVQCL